jgi:hypothetical protein
MKNGHNISSDYNYNKSSNDNLSNINNYTYNLDGTQKGTPILQRGVGEGSTTNHTFQIDYENPAH